MFQNEGHKIESYSIKIKQVLEACDAIYQQCLTDNVEFLSHKNLKVDNIKTKRVALGYEAGSNTTIIKGKKIWLEKNQHRLMNPAAETNKESDPMLGLIQKIRSDLHHEADEKIKKSEQHWNEEKKALLQEIDNFAEQLDKLATVHEATESQLSEAKLEIKNLEAMCKQQSHELSFMSGEKQQLQELNDTTKQQIDTLYQQYEIQQNMSLAECKRMIDAAKENELQRQASSSQQIAEIKTSIDSDKKFYIHQIRDKDDALMQRDILIGNLLLVKSRLDNEHEIMKNTNIKLKAEYAELDKKHTYLEGEAFAFKEMIHTIKSDLMLSKRDNIILDTKIKSLEMQLLEIKCDE